MLKTAVAVVINTLQLPSIMVGHGGVGGSRVMSLAIKIQELLRPHKAYGSQVGK